MRVVRAGPSLLERATALAAAAALLVAAAPAWAKPPVWIVHGKGATVTLFGSVHVLPREVDWEPDALKAALAGADELWFETPISQDAMLAAARAALARGMLAPDQSLSAMLGEDGRARLAKTADDLRLPLPQLDRLKPWLAELTIGSAAYARDGATSDQGVERRLADAAPAAERHSFETVAQQISLFADAPEAEQIASLEDTLKTLQDDPGQTRRLIDAWLAADLTGIDREGLMEMKASDPALFKRVLTDRNARWLAILDRRLRRASTHPGRRDRIVVVVGVGHLVGQGGLPALLRASGFRVEGPRTN